MKSIATRILGTIAWSAAGLAWVSVCQAQWQSQSILIKPGWTAIYLHVDASYQTLDKLVGADPNNPIEEVWLWQPPPSTLQFVTSPQTPLTGSSQWANWARLGLGLNRSLRSLAPNTACLVHSVATTNYVWSLKGQPVAPAYTWTSSGLNFLGFPTPSGAPPLFDSFLAPAPLLAAPTDTQIYQYPGGNLGPTNPVQVLAYHVTPVTRGQAFWIKSDQFNSYFGPFQVSLQNGAGIAFGDSSGQYSFHLRNTTATSVTVAMNLLASEAPPAGQASVASAPPLLVRGLLNNSNLTYSFSALNVGGSQSWQLAPQGQPGSDIVVVLGLNRYAMNAGPGAVYGGILEFTDGSGLEQVDVAVSAVAGSTAGLWVGNAQVNQVANYLKNYQTDANNNLVLSNGAYVVSSINTNIGPTASAFPLRLIVHNDGTNAVLLQRIYYGFDTSSNYVLATSESALDPTRLSTARRISSTQFPWTSSNLVWSLSGQLAQGGVLQTTATVNYDDQASNPFLHTYHPDHDNLDSRFENQLPLGSESYQITRQITLNVAAPGGDFASLTSSAQSISGNYSETITLTGLGGATRSFNVAGAFSLNRISNLATLARQ
jgi:hypothetical protein